MNAFLLTHWKAIAVGLVISLLFGTCLVYRGQARSLKSQLDSAKVELKANAETFERLAKESDELMDRLFTAQRQANEVKTVYVTKVEKLKSEPIPKTCPDAIDWAIENKEDLKWESLP